MGLLQAAAEHFGADFVDELEVLNQASNQGVAYFFALLTEPGPVSHHTQAVPWQGQGLPIRAAVDRGAFLGAIV